MTHGNHMGAATLAILAALLAGCASLPQDVIERAERAQARIAAETQSIDDQEKQYRAFLGSDGGSRIEPYAEREGWEAFFAEARAKLKAADAIYTGEIQPIIERNAAKDAQAARSAVEKITALVAGARESAQKWSARRDFLVRAAEQPAEVFKDCETGLAAVKQAHAGLDSRAARAKRDHGARAADIDRLVGPLKGSFDAASAAARTGSGEYRKLRSGRDADLAAFGDACAETNAAAEDFLKGAPAAEAKLAELDRSYSRTLMDMKVTYKVTIRREAWNDSYANPQTHLTDYRISNVDVDTFTHVTDIRGTIATFSRGWTGGRLRLARGVEQARWNALQIDPEAQWHEGDTKADFWLQAVEVKFFHKYLLQENGKTTETDWTEVTEDLYRSNLDNLGMDVESKPFGSFESEKLTHAAPPGMAYVGNPRYGRWESDGRGGSIWTWVGPYLFYRTLFGSPVSYGRSDWNSWSRGYRGTRPFYGGSSSAPRWGTRSRTVQSSPKMRGSTFARGGGLRRPPSTVRGAGPIRRGGSFGASGK